MKHYDIMSAVCVKLFTMAVRWSCSVSPVRGRRRCYSLAVCATRGVGVGVGVVVVVVVDVNKS